MNDAGIRSVYPGEAENTVFMGHGSTFGATFADSGALKPGDEVTVNRSDGREFTYRAVGYEIIPGTVEGRDKIYEWSHPDSPATMTLFSCSDEQGRPGSATHRLTWRFVMVTADGAAITG
jgi:sortase (surface protein transpeptidase)